MLFQGSHVTVLYLVFLSFPVFLLFFFHLSFRRAMTLGTCHVLVQLSHFCQRIVGVMLLQESSSNFKDLYKPARGITARKRYVSVLLFCLFQLYSIRFAFHRLLSFQQVSRGTTCLGQEHSSVANARISCIYFKCIGPQLLEIIVQHLYLAYFVRFFCRFFVRNMYFLVVLLLCNQRVPPPNMNSACKFNL